MEREKVCEELDRVLLELMSSLQELSTLRMRYAAAASEGYFSMAKARYAMGAQTVGALQYDTVMSALVHVRPNPETVSHDETVSPTEECFEFKVERIQLGKVDNSHTSQLEETVREESHLRRRKPVSAEGHSVEDLPPVEEEEGKEEKGVREGELPKDPLKWFGILVPQSLRHSQQCFIHAVTHCADLASVQQRVESLRRQYRNLLERKRELGQREEGEQTS